MKKNSKERLFEVMGRLDKTFKTRLNEGFGEEATDDVVIPDETSDEMPVEEPAEEKTVEEKYEELKSKVEELYTMIHGGEEEAEEVPAAEEVPDMENLQEWNFDKKKGEKKEEKSEETEEETEEKSEETEEPKKVDEIKPAGKVPVAAIAKVGK